MVTRTTSEDADSEPADEDDDEGEHDDEDDAILSDDIPRPTSTKKTPFRSFWPQETVLSLGG